MPTYLGQTVGQDFLDMIVRIYRGGYVAMHPAHLSPAESDAVLVSQMEAASVRGGSDADTLARRPFYLASPTAYYNSLILADDATAYFPLQETTGTTAVNAVSGGPNGTISGGVTLGVPGPISGGTGMRFNGTTGKVTVPAGPYESFGAGPLSIECWYRLPSAPAATVCLADTKDNGTLNPGPALLCDSAILYFRIVNTGGTSVDAGGSLPAPGPAWHHVVGVLRRSPDQMQGYIDGVPVGGAVAFPAATNASAASGLGIGASSTGAAWFFTGDLAHVALYTVALTPEQILAHYAARLPRTVY